MGRRSGANTQQWAGKQRARESKRRRRQASVEQISQRNSTEDKRITVLNRYQRVTAERRRVQQVNHRGVQDEKSPASESQRSPASESQRSPGSESQKSPRREESRK